MSSLLRNIITPKQSIPTDLIAKIKQIGLFDIDDRDNIIPLMVGSAIQKLEQYTSLVFLPSTVQANYVQKGGGTRIEMFFCNGVPTNDKGFPIFNGLPENTGFGGIDGAYFLLLSGCQDITVTYDAGFTELPNWAIDAIARDVVWQLENQGSEDVELSPQSKKVAAPFRKTLHEFIL